mmetsp:Transcript_29748/g.41082  ORF Transcript_29748/g.41082 Transcript_29748/m.41082 type:complete len:110 (-) Transcript_29748:145-474(-)|eukprot:CAMPEP_0196570816 /NCGR_PEP_ID=MMETSP1081-20130531/998_1 /TAXON_ID=36882 /ORGANISM="Pyramimonas amylifera, Strain CCMP720" /LENGTH=109 /DNA_ID=CAMNT_0041887487 /DNA_START=150 /DNA_END=479 /DNA_ORIENTATION=+
MSSENKENAFTSSVMGFFDRAKSATLDAAEATKQAANKAKLLSEIQYLEMKVKYRKELFGVQIFGPLVNNEHGEVDRLVATCKQEVEEIMAKIGVKKAEIDLIRAGVSE